MHGWMSSTRPLVLVPPQPQGSELPHLAPRALQQVVSLVSKGMVNLPPVNGTSAPPKKTVLLASHSQPTSLVCSAGGGRQVLVANQKAAPGAPVRAGPVQPSCSNKPVSFVMSSGGQGNQVHTAPRGGFLLCVLQAFWKSACSCVLVTSQVGVST